MKAVFFDYDGVLTRDRTGSLTMNHFLSVQTGIPYDRVCRALERHNRRLNEGEATYAQIWSIVCAELERELPFDLVTRAFESTPLNEGMLQLARDLKRHCGAVGIITDNKKERIDYLKQYQRLPQLFAPIVVSAEVGCTKADSRIFEVALACAAVDPGESVFIDNTPSNLVAAAALGMKTVYFDDEKNDVDALARLLSAQVGVNLPLS